MGCGTLAALALGGAGAGLGIDAASNERSAMNNAVNQQLATQAGFQRKATPVFQQSLGASTPQAMQGQQGQGAQQFLDASRNAAVTPLSLPSLPGAQNASNIAYQGQQAKNQLGQQANAGLQGYSNIGLQQYLKNLQANSQLGLIGNQAQQAASIFPALLQGAQQSSAGEASLGSLLGSLGSVIGLGSASGAFGGLGGGAVSAPVGWGSTLSNAASDPYGLFAGGIPTSF